MPTTNEDLHRLAEMVRQACMQTALTAYEDARMDGLCHQGAWEIAIEALQGLNVAALVHQLHTDSLS
jgi:hypothetical protein